MLFDFNHEEFADLRYGASARRSSFNRFSPAYLFSNENLTELFQSIDVQDKDVLTACAGSGDILFNSKLRGAGRVDQFDTSLFPKYIYEIKYQAIKNLTHSEFLRFFYHSKSFLNKKSGDKIVPHLSQQATYLLDLATYSQSCAEWMFRLLGSISSNCPIKNSYPQKSPYIASQQNYNIVHQGLPLDGSFYSSDLIDLPTLLERQYDIIYLSNICQYIRNIQDFDHDVVSPLTPYLKDNGKIICYQFSGHLGSWGANELQDQFGQSNKWKISTGAMRNIFSPARYKPGKPKEAPDRLFTMEKNR